MKKITLIIALLCFALIGKAQFVNTQTIASPTTLYKSKGGLTADSALIIPSNIFTDTTSANFSVVSKYVGSIIITTGSNYWFRGASIGTTANKWYLINTSAASLISISQGYGVLASPNPITTTGTITTDTVNIVSKNYFNNLAFKTTDTAAMLLPYLKISDSGRYATPKRISDSLGNLVRLKAGTSAGVGLYSNSWSQIALFGSGGGNQSTFYGFTGYNSNLGSSYTTRSFTDKGYVDSSLNLKLNISDTSAMLSNYVTTAGYGLLKSSKILRVDTTSGYISTWALLKKKIDSLAAISTGTGTVTSVATNNGSGISGGTITTSGTLVIDTLNIGTRLWRQKGVDSLNGLIALRVKYTDTASMLTPYLRKSDTASMLSNYTTGSGVDGRITFWSGTRSLTSASGLSYNTATSTLSTPNLVALYLSSQASLGGSVKILSSNFGYQIYQPSDAARLMFRRFDLSTDSIMSFESDNTVMIQTLKGSGTRNVVVGSNGVLTTSSTPIGGVTSVATNTGTGIYGGTITTSGTLANDTTNLATRLWRQKGVDSLVGLVNLKLNISDTASMLANRLKISDTATMLSNRLKISDTATMLSNRLKISDTSTMLNGYIRTASNGITKSSQNIVLGGLLNQNTTITDSTFSMLFTNTKRINNSSKFGLNGEMNLIGVTNDDATQNVYAGVYGSQSWTSAASYTLFPRSIYSAVNGTNYLANTGALSSTGVVSASSAWLLMSNTGTISNLAAFHAKTPLQQTSATTMTGKVTTYGAVTIDNLRDSSDVQSKFQNMYAINQKGANDTSKFAGIISGNVINATTLGGTLSTAAQTNVTSLGTLTALNVSGTATITAPAGSIATAYNGRVADNVTSVFFYQNNGSTLNSYIQSGSTGGGSFLIGVNGATAININSSQQVFNAANSTTWNTTSDRRVKENIIPISSALNMIDSLNPVVYDYTQEFSDKRKWKANQRFGNYGFIAQEYEKVFPKYVTTSTDSINGKEVTDFKGIDQTPVSALNTAAIKELYELVKKQAAKIEELELRIKKLEDK